MKKLVMLAAAVLALAPFAAAQAEDAVVSTDVAVEAAADATVAPVEHTLADGTKVVVEGEAVSVVAADGTKTPAPDGTHTLADGTTLTTKDGKVAVAAEAAAE